MTPQSGCIRPIDDPCKWMRIEAMEGSRVRPSAGTAGRFTNARARASINREIGSRDLCQVR